MTDGFERDLRAAALALVEDAPPPPPFPRRPEPRRRTGTWLVAAVATVVVAIAAAVVTTNGGGPTGGNDTVIAADPVPTTTPVAPAPNYTCGTQLPGEVRVPSGYTGPQSGPAQEADLAPHAGQFVQRWTSATGSIELRWPSDPNLPGPVVGADNRTGPPRLASSASVGPRQTARGSTVTYQLLWIAGELPAEECRQIQLAMYDTDGGRVQATVEWLRRAPFKPTTPLIASRQEVAAPPAIGRCQAPNPVVPPPNREGGGDGTTFANPEAALDHFVETNRSMPLRGWVELRLPDGTFAFGAQVNGQWVAVVSVGPSGSRWAVTSFEATGC